jgi:hypothetical protein
MSAKKQVSDDTAEVLGELEIPESGQVSFSDSEASSEEELEVTTFTDADQQESQIISTANDSELPHGFSVERALKLLDAIEHDARTLRSMLGSASGAFTSLSSPIPGFMTPASHTVSQYYAEDDGIEGTFDGERMVDANGKSYQVPPNYASKSKLIEGDPLKLYIGSDGKYVYKQLGPVERRNVGGVLRMEGNHYVVDSDEGHTYGVLTACVTYYMALYRIKPGDRVNIMIPAAGMARWAVIDNPA